MSDAYSVTAVRRAIDVLGAFSELKPELSLTEIAAATKLHKATVFRLLATLSAGGLLARNQDTGLYRVGPRVIGLAETAKVASGFLVQARPHMRRIRDLLNETVYVAVRTGDSRTNLEQLEGIRDIRRVVAIGEPRPLHVGSTSRVLLACLPDREIDDYLQRTDLAPPYPHPSMTADDLRRQIALIRRQGYAESFNRRIAEGASVSAAIAGPGSTIWGALTVSVPISRYDPSVRLLVIEQVTNAARALSRELGGGDQPVPANDSNWQPMPAG